MKSTPILNNIIFSSLFLITLGLGELDQAIDGLDRRNEITKDKKIDNREDR